MTNQTEQNQSNEFKNRCYGLVIVKSENSNFNADFTGNARRLPDEKGTIYATDKALKYAIRRYWVDEGKDVFVWRSHLPNGNVRTREERMEFMKEKLVKKEENNDLRLLIKAKKWFEELDSEKKEENISKKEIDEDIKEYKDELLSSNAKKIEDRIKNKVAEIKKIIMATVFAKSIDTKLFGVTYTGKGDEGTLSLTGPVQISYGINKLNENTNYTNDILSPYPTDDKGTTQSSIGKENKTLTSYYVYDFSINPKNIISHYNSSQDIVDAMKLTHDDINSLKKALMYCVTALDTTSKKDSENVMLLFVKMPEDSKEFLPAMKNLVEIEKQNDGDVKINISKVKDLIDLKNENLNDDNNEIVVELFYNDKTTKVTSYGNWENKGL